MNDLKKHALALSFIAVLVCIKFVYIPIIDWQDEQLGTLALLERKINKVDHLLTEEEQLTVDHEMSTRQVLALSQGFYHNQDPEPFKRQQQKNIEAELLAHKLKIKNIGWQITMENADVNLNQFSINYTFDGKSEDVINYLLAISANEKFSELTEFNLSFVKQKAGKLGRVSARLRRVFFMDLNQEQMTKAESRA
ncbi:hypothetical protein [Thalassomonas actiniarum]|uniref:Uncharacterized protein n=1 Tax=Thalassomonas actiniarum TaxID=485447 RepID=A0AAF0C4Z4_9GAMM|nr:hypothetical protein [Thalassomonas actiniarum]WDE00524.1 hypothetical protein SG35_007780 [Thalassomonas actiniarum]